MPETFALVPPLQLIGLLGAMTYIATYFLLTARILTSEHVVYFVLNLMASSLVLISLADAFNVASLLIQVFWILASIVGVTVRLARPKSPAARDRLRPIR
ncbi:MAG: hypothetical protein AAF919_09995 [Pseudomonadota bacterium]